MTLGTLSIVSGITLMMTSGMPVYGMPQAFITGFGRALWLGLPAPVYVAVAVVGAVWLVQRKTVLGTYIYAIGGNSACARSCPASRPPSTSSSLSSSAHC